MDALALIFEGWTISNPVSFLLLMVAMTLFYLFAAKARAGHRYHLRPIEGYDAVQKAVGQAAEMGKPLHMALGTGGIGKDTTLETLAGMYTLQHLSHQAALCDTPLLVSVGDATILPAAQEIMFQGYSQAGYPDEYDSRQVQFLAPDPVAYAAGVMGTVNQEDLAANVMVGTFGDEFLLISETGVRKNVLQVGGTSNPNTLPFVYASTDHALIGEEIYAAGAYLQQDPNHIGGLMAQDVMRTALVITAVLTVVLRTLGIF